MTRFACLILLFLLHGPIGASESVYRQRTSYWVDTSDQTTAQSLASKPFADFEGLLRLGFIAHPVWLRVEIKPARSDIDLMGPAGTGPRSAVLRVAPYMLDRIELHREIAGVWTLQAAGDLLPKRHRGLCPDNTHCFVMDAPSPEGETVYLKVLTRTVMVVNTEVLSHDEVSRVAAWRVAATSVSLALAFALLCIGLWILIFEYRSRLLLAYCGFQSAILIFMISVGGLLPDLLPGWRLESVDFATHLIALFRVAMTTLLCWAVVADHKPPRLYHRLCAGLVITNLASVVIALMGETALALEIAVWTFLFSALAQFYGIFAARGDRSAQITFLRVGFSVYAILTSIGFLLALGIMKSGPLIGFPSYFADLRLNGAPVGLVFFFLILLERASLKANREREFERLRIEAAQATAAGERLRDRQGFIDMIAHELQNPLATIQFASKSLQRTAGTGGDASRHFHSVDVSVKRISDFIDHVAALSRVEAMDRPACAASIPAIELVEEIVSEYPDQERFVIRAERDTTFHADRQLLTVLVDNLVSNARKYSTPGSVVTIDIRRQADRTRFSITNQVPLERVPDHTRLFERFYRHPESMSIPGSGLGLSVARLAAEKIGARIDVGIDGTQVCFTAEVSA